MTSYKSIDPEATYDARAVISQGNKLGDLEKYLKVLETDKDNPTIWRKAGEDLEEDGNYFNSFREEFDKEGRKTLLPPRSPRPDLEDAVSETKSNIALFSKKNKSALLNKLSPKDYFNLSRSVPLYKTGGEEHDKFVDAINEVRKLGEIGGDSQAMHKYVMGRLEKEKVAQWKIASVSRNGARDIPIIFQGYLARANHEVASIMYEKDGKTVREEFLQQVFLDSLKKAEDAYDDVTYSEDEKNDVWENDVRPYYTALFGKVYEIEKAEDKKDPSNLEKQDRDKKRDERRAKGMPF